MTDPTIIQKPSPNFMPGRAGCKIMGVAIHIEQGHEYGTDASFATTAAQASSHYGIAFTGVATQFVQEKDTAWHAGLPTSSYTDPAQYPKWPLYIKGSNPNHYLIGIEHEGWSVPMFGQPPTTPTDAQYATTSWLIARASKTWGFPINAATIVRHGDIYLAKAHLCPGANYDLDRLISQAQAALVERATISVS